jgi:4-aminobutyrate aminotransferase-like enzyme
VLRMLPPLILTQSEAEQALHILDQTLGQMRSASRRNT